MEKKLKIIKEPPYLLAIGDNITKDIELPSLVVEKSVSGVYFLFTIHNIFDFDIKNQYELVAHLPIETNIAIPGVSLLPKIDSKKFWKNQVENHWNPETSEFYSYEEGFIEGYEYCKGQNGYSKEDMIYFGKLIRDHYFCNNEIPASIEDLLASKEKYFSGNNIQYPKEFIAKYDPIYGFNGTISGDKFVLNGEYIF